MGSSCSFFKRWKKDNNKIDEDIGSSPKTGQDNPAFTESLDTDTVSVPSEITVEINTNPAECAQDASEVLIEVNTNSTECTCIQENEEKKDKEKEDEKVDGEQWNDTLLKLLGQFNEEGDVEDEEEVEEDEEEETEDEEEKKESDTTTLQRYHVNRQNDMSDVSVEINTNLKKDPQEEDCDDTTLKREHAHPLNANYMDHRDIPFTQCCEQSLNSSGAYTSSGYATGGRISEETDYKTNENGSEIPDRPVPMTFMPDVAEKLKHYNEGTYNESTGSHRNVKVYIQEDNAKRQKLVRNYSYLRKNIHTEDLCDSLIDECIIDIEEKQTILNEASSEGRADVLLQTLLQKPPFQFSDIYESFVKALIPDHSFVVERLNSTEPFQAIEMEDIDKEFPYARNCLESKLDSVAEQVDAKTTALMCFEQGGISLMDYLEIFPNFNRRKKAAKTLLQSVMEGCHESLYVFINVLKDLNCDSALDILKNFRPQAEYTKEPNITVACRTAEVDTTVLQRTPNGYKIVININIPEMEQRLNSSIEATEYVLKNVHCEIVRVTKGSVVILLKAYDNCLLQHLQTSKKDYSFLCNLIKEVLRSCFQDDFPQGELQFTLTLEENDIEDEHSQSSRETIQHRKNYICKELNSSKYTKAFQDEGFAIDETQKSTDLSRLGKMKRLMNIVLQDETKCDKFIEIANRLESAITCKRILWNGNKHQIIKGMLQNIEYLLDEIIPSHILQHINEDNLKEDGRCEILVSETKDRRASVVVLLKLILNGHASLVANFYDALLASGYVDVADQIRTSGEEEKENLNIKGTQYPSKQTQETGQCDHRYLFKGEFNVRFEEDTAMDCDRWETNILSMRLKSPTDLTFHLTPLHDNDKSMVDVDVEFEDTHKTAIKCVNKAVFKNEEVVDVTVSTTKCIIKTSLTTNITSIQRVGGILVIKSRNASLRIETNTATDSTEMNRLSPNTYTRINTAMAERPVSYAGSRFAISPRNRNSLERMVQTYSNTGAEGNDIDKGYHSTETLRVSSATEVYPQNV